MAKVAAKRRQRQKQRARLRRDGDRGSIPPSPQEGPAEQPRVEGTRSSRRRARQRLRRREAGLQQDPHGSGDLRRNGGTYPGGGGQGEDNVAVTAQYEPPCSDTDDDDDDDDEGYDPESTPCPPPRPWTCPAQTSPSPGIISRSSSPPSTPCPSPRPHAFPAPPGLSLPDDDETRESQDGDSTPSTPCPSSRRRRREPRTPAWTPAPKSPTPSTPFLTPTGLPATPGSNASTESRAERFYTPLLSPPELFYTPQRLLTPAQPTPSLSPATSLASSAAVSAILWRDDSPQADVVAGEQAGKEESNEEGEGEGNGGGNEERDEEGSAQSDGESDRYRTPRPLSQASLALSPSHTPSTTALSPLPTSSAAVASTQPRSGLDSEWLDTSSTAPVGTWASSDASAAVEARTGVCALASPTDTSSNTETTTDDAATDLDDTDIKPLLAVWPRDVRLPLKGFHVSSDGGLSALSSRARALRAAIPPDQPLGVQAFCGSPRRHALPALDPADAAAFRDTHDTTAWAVHANHTTNLASCDEKTALAGLDFVAREMQRCLDLGVPVLCVHLGSDVRAADDDAVVVRVARALRELLATVPVVTLALENMVRASVCTQPWSLTLLARILDAVDSPRAAACVDICHAHIAEYDLSTRSGLDALESVLGREVRWERIAGFHISDAATPHGRACDGHASIGDGLIPLSAFRRILRHPAVLGRVPYYLETPAYAPSLRPAAFPAVARWEAARHLAEWAFLERAICMPERVWVSRQHVEEAQYRRERERCHMAIRNLLRPERAASRRDGKNASAADVAIAAFRADRRAALVRAAIVRHARERIPLSCPVKTPRSADARAADEAAALAYASFTTRGGYTMRHRAVSVKLE